MAAEKRDTNLSKFKGLATMKWPLEWHSRHFRGHGMDCRIHMPYTNNNLPSIHTKNENWPREIGVPRIRD
eukprot:scaffold2164_cov106-Cylindrotheca_fusiformis.AAC.1